MNWDRSFEAQPNSLDCGAITHYILRQLKEQVKLRLSVEHVWSDLDSPICLHYSGKCSIVAVTDGVPIALNVIGGLAYDNASETLYRDRGSGLGYESICTLDHASLLNLTDDACHTQYVLRSGGDPAVSQITLQAGSTIVGLSTTAIDYADGDIVPYSLHIGSAGDGGALHADDSLTYLSGVYLSPYDKIKTATAEIGPVDVLPSDKQEWLIGECAFLPQAVSDMIGTFIIQPLFNELPPDDWIAGFTFYNANVFLTYTLHMTAEVLA